MSAFCVKKQNSFLAHSGFGNEVRKIFFQFVFRVLSEKSKCLQLEDNVSFARRIIENNSKMVNRSFNSRALGPSRKYEG